MKEYAKTKGGQCLSERYNHNKEKLSWLCEKGHNFLATAHDIKGNNVWCPKCSGKAKPTIKELQEIAKSRGGELLSTAYVNSRTKLEWKCADGHTFEMISASIMNSGQWCPQCRWYYTEEKCRFILEYLLQTEFKKTRQVLGNRLELDGYSKEYNLAFEYNGAQHFEEIKFFHSEKYTLSEAQKRDSLKEKLCREKGIKIILIPDFANKIKDGLVGWIVKELERVEVQIIRKPEEISFDEFKKSFSAITMLNGIAQQRGGKLISNEYKGSEGNLEWECKKGHRWFASPNNVKNNESWCLKCSGSEKKTIEQMQELAKLRGGKCLSEKYINLSTKLIWECKEGHQFQSPPVSIIHAKCWCPECSKLKKLTIEEMQHLAIRNQGLCLSKEYKNSSTKLLWQCKEGHQWWATPVSIKHGNTWCLTCFRIKTARQ